MGLEVVPNIPYPLFPELLKHQILAGGWEGSTMLGKENISQSSL